MPPPDPANPFDADVAAVAPTVTAPSDFTDDAQAVTQQQAAPLTTSMYAASKTDPERQGKVVKLADSLGLQPDLVDRNYEYFQGVQRYNDQRQGVDMATVFEQRPALAKWLQDRDNATLSQDTLPALTAMHDRLQQLYPPAVTDDREALPWLSGVIGPAVRRAIGRTGQTLLAIPAILQQAGREALDINEAPNPSSPLGQIYSAEDLMKREEQAAQTYQTTGMKRVVGAVAGMVADPQNILLPVAGGMAAMRDLQLIAKSVRLSAGAIGDKTIFGASQRVADVDLATPSVIGEIPTQAAALKGAAGVQGIQAGTGALSEDIRQRQAEGKGAALQIGDMADMASQGALAYLTGKAGGLIGPLRALRDVKPDLGEVGSDILRQAVLGGLQSGGGGAISNLFAGRAPPTAGEFAMQYLLGAIPGGVLAAGNLPSALAMRSSSRLAQDVLQAHQAQADARNMAAVGALAASSPLVKRSGDRAAALMKAVIEASGEEQGGKLFFQGDAWDEHWRSVGQDPATAAAALTGDNDAYVRAQATGGHIEVPQEQFQTQLAGSPHFVALLGKAAMGPDRPTLEQANDFLKDLPGHLDDLRKQMEDESRSPILDENGRAIFDDIRDQLIDNGYDAQAASLHATVLQQHYVRLADRWNAGAEAAGREKTTAADEYRKANLRIQSALPEILSRPELRSRLDPVLDQLRHVDANVDPEQVPADLRQTMQALGSMGIDLAKHPTNATVYEAVKQHLRAQAAAKPREATQSRHPETHEESAIETKRAATTLGSERIHEELSKTLETIDKVPVVDAANVPYGMGMDVTASKIYRDPNYPRFGEVNGKKIDTEQASKVHEITEKRLRDGGMAYEEAHPIADAVEEAYLRSQGMTQSEVDAYEKSIFSPVAADTKWTGEPPADLDRGPYEEMGDTNLLTRPDQRTFDQPGHRASITFGPTGTTINLTGGRNLSSLLHEFGHLFLENFADLASRPDAPAEVSEDWAKVMAWLDVKDRSEIQTAQHEKFAQGIEQYFLEGRAPSPVLHRVFATIKQWMLNIYRQAKGLGIELTPEIRGVFDRLLASEEETVAANAHLAADPIFTTAAQAGMTEQQFASYQKRALDDRQEREETLQRKFMAAFTKAQSKQYGEDEDRTRAEVMGELNDDKPLAAVTALQRGRRPDGTPLPPGFDGLKLSKAELVAIYGKDNLARLPGPGTERNRGKRVYATEGGHSLEDAANLLGFRSGDELFHALLNAPDLKAHAEAMTSERMRALHPDPLLSGQAATLAIDAAHNQRRADLMDQEASALAKQLGRTATPRQLLRLTAEDAMSKMALQDIRPDKYQIAEARHGREAFAHAAAGRFEKALISQQKRQLNFELYRAATDAQEEAGKLRQQMAGFSRSSTRERIGKAGGWEYTVARQENGQTFTKTFATEEEAKLETAKWPGAAYERTSSYLAAIDQTLAPISFRAGKAGAKPGQAFWRTVPLEQLRGVRDTAMDIATQATNRLKMLSAAKATAYADVQGQLGVGIVAHSNGPRAVRLGDDLLSQIRRPVETFIDNQKTVAAICRRMDGNKDGGSTWNLWQRPLNEAQDRQAAMSAEACARYNEILDRHGKLGVASIKAPLLHLREYVPEIKASMSRLTRIMVTLNWGNAGNRERLMAGFHWDEAQVQAIMKGLDARDRQLVRDVWEFESQHWPQMKALEERIHGVAPEKVEATPFQLGGEEMPGGYHPIVYDNRLSAPPLHETAETRAEAMLAGKGGGYAMTAHGHLKERQGSQGRPLNLSIDVIGRHVATVIHDLSHRETLIDLNRLLNDKAIKDPMEAHWGTGTWKQFNSQLRHVAAGDQVANTGLEKFIDLFRQGGNMAQRSFNVVSAIQQLAGIPNALPRLGAVNFLKAIPPAFDPRAHAKADAWSPTLARRNELHSSNLATAISRTSALGFLNPVRHVGMLAINTMWKVMDAHAWWGGYYKAMDETGGNHERSLRIADQIMIDTQGGFEAKDVPQALQGGAFAKLFTNQMSWANANFNLMASSVYRFADSQAKGQAAIQLASDMLVYLLVSPALYLAARQALTGQDMSSWSDPSKIAPTLAGEGAYTILTSMPLLREAAAIAKDGERYEGPQGMTGVQNLMKTLEAARKGSDTASARRSAVMAASTVLGGLPGAQINHSIDGWLWAEEHGANPLWPTLVGPPPKH